MRASERLFRDVASAHEEMVRTKRKFTRWMRNMGWDPEHEKDRNEAGKMWDLVNYLEQCLDEYEYGQDWPR